MPDNTAGQDEGMLTKAQQGYFEFARRQGLPRGDYLELGPDTGLLTQFAAKAIDNKLWLYEPNSKVHQSLSERTFGRNFEIRTDMDDFSAIPDGSIGLCVMIHVLDHLLDPLKTIEQLRDKMCPDGRLLIVTHNERSFLAKLLRGRWPAYCLQHPLLFNRKSMARFLQISGFKVVKLGRSVNYFPLTYLFKHLCHAIGVRSARTWQINAFPIPLKLGNMITIAKPFTAHATQTIKSV